MTAGSIERGSGLLTTWPSAAAAAAPGWRASYRRNLVLTDLTIVVAVVFASQALRVSQRTRVFVDGFGSVNYWIISALLSAVWMAALVVNGCYDQRVLGTGSSEYGRIVRASVYLFGFVAIVAYLLQAEITRSYLAIALPLGLAGLISDRWVWRRLLREYRRNGSHLNSVLIVGTPGRAGELARRLEADPVAGLRVVGVLTPGSVPPEHESLPDPAEPGGSAPGAPPGSRDDGPDPARARESGTADLSAGEFGVDAVLSAIRELRADTVAVAASEAFGSHEVRRLGWKLEGSGVRLALAPELTDVAGPRILIHPVAGLPLMYVDEARFRGPKLVVKTLLDFLLATGALLLLSPLLLLVAAVIKIKDPGPVFFRQERVGFGGQIFRVWKFRTMTPGADKQFASARESAGQASATFYKAADDRRITPLGGFLRRTSIDELPQLFNVLAGQMSIVGPRPLVPGEAADVGHFLERRRLVRPGITGLWQVSGRSDVSAEDRIRLDSYYVENWSVAGDLVIIFRTVRIVLTREGAY